ncbi:hypothetical protein B2K_40395 [Paenibacillus mucilaginosus K02]|uniref:Uncharacterized protein n=1 Tax=Paenibacillus mucilaginosus K02 TaxID=997761 RepID=R9UNJ0_9BACL|nr:hypothetical protein B2K_40395 [Paenibacillus mucilaginosus K02]
MKPWDEGEDGRAGGWKPDPPSYGSQQKQYRGQRVLGPAPAMGRGFFCLQEPSFGCTPQGFPGYPRKEDAKEDTA